MGRPEKGTTQEFIGLWMKAHREGHGTAWVAQELGIHPRTALYRRGRINVRLAKRAKARGEPTKSLPALAKIVPSEAFVRTWMVAAREGRTAAWVAKTLDLSTHTVIRRRQILNRDGADLPLLQKD